MDTSKEYIWTHFVFILTHLVNQSFDVFLCFYSKHQ